MPHRFALLLLLSPWLLLAPAASEPQPPLTLDDLRRCSNSTWAGAASASWGQDGRGQAELLGYVTPWNARGYEVAEAQAARFTYVSPVWYQLRPSQTPGKVLDLTGGHDFDAGWIARVRAAGAAKAEAEDQSCAADGGSKGPRIVPRVLWEINQFVPEELVGEVVRLLADEAKAKGYDGWTLEFPIDPPAGAVFEQLVQALRAALGPQATLIVAPPAFQTSYFRPGDDERFFVDAATLARLAKHVDRFVIMTYDAGVTPSPVFNAPLPWVKRTVERAAGKEGKNKALRSKILVGLPWYGRHDDGNPIVGHELDRLLRQDAGAPAEPGSVSAVVPGSAHLDWDAAQAEHVVSYTAREVNSKAKRAVGYPTPPFFQARWRLAREEGLAGLGIWELGQGLGCFPELF